MEDCIFCKIVNGDIPSYKVYEDEHLYAFLDISQTTPGHTLVVPKKHTKDLFDIDEKTIEQVYGKVPLIAKALKKAFPTIKGMNVINNNGAVAYQSVFHFHVHLIPRYDEKDDFSIHFGNHQSYYTPEQLEAMSKLIAAEIRE
ncbi:HIT family protein [Enterococcus hirae]|jgi:histidine triad (HIT) family protein|nr:HIT family protein [Enterococcaceae bacterium]MCI1919839.1 HIT family protein [Enterococcaceae bacterium]MDM8212645.1 HIT family protein [Enterococcus hirae]